MSANEWAGLAVATFTLVGGVVAGVRFLVKHFLYELKPNGGSSMKDKVNRLEEKVDLLTDLVKELIGK
jgi:H+/Cl- antiporter ClcA